MITDYVPYMRQAIEEAERTREAGEYPFAAVLVDPAGGICLTVPDRIERDRDNTAHAETQMVKRAVREIGRDLTGYTVVTTTEPCPMCFTTCWLARCSRVVYGTTMAEVAAITGGQPEELRFPADQLNAFPQRRVELVGGVLREECLALFDPFRVPDQQPDTRSTATS